MSGMPDGEKPRRRLQRIIYTNLVVASLVDGRIDPSEQWVLRSAAKMLDIDGHLAQSWLEMAVRAPSLRLKVPDTAFGKRMCIDLMIAVCKADGVVRPEEMRMLKKVAPQFRVSTTSLIMKIKDLTLESLEGSLTAAAEAASDVAADAIEMVSSKGSRSSRKRKKRSSKPPVAKVVSFIPEADVVPVAEPVPDEPDTRPLPRIPDIDAPTGTTREIPVRPESIDETRRVEPKAPEGPVSVPDDEPGDLADRLSAIAGAEGLGYSEMELTNSLAPSSPLGNESPLAFDIPVMDLSAASLAMEFGPAPSAPAPASEAKSSEEPVGPRKLKILYCWYRGDSSGFSSPDAAAVHFLDSCTEVELTASGAKVEAVYGGDADFAMKPRDGLMFDIGFRKPGGITDDDVIILGTCESPSRCEFALLLDFS